MKNVRMFLRLIIHAIRERKSRTLIIFFAISVGIGIISALSSVYYDINTKMAKELRAYGANISVKAAEGDKFSIEKIDNIKKILGEESVVGVRPDLYGVADVKSNNSVLKSKMPVVVVGTWFDQIDEVNPYWKITGSIPVEKGVGEAVLGETVAKKLNYGIGDKLKLTYGKLSEKFIVGAVIKTGGNPDNKIFLDIEEAWKIFGNKGYVNTAKLSVIAGDKKPKSLIASVNKNVSGIEAGSIKRIASSEGKILSKIKSVMYLVVLVILASTVLCVSTTMMTIIAERKKEIALKKALGASNIIVISEFLTEAFVLGLTGGIAGYVFGYLCAQLIGQSVFDSYISFKIVVVFATVVLSAVVAGASAMFPLKRVINVDPSVVLKGE